ncbi:MAG TPA: methylamine utilization protein [Methylophaga aminisulfidivorans]|uniref:Methylamine utilization protein n=1 Tax=Methylophaga aminisulfidivorans TaxID=230105 RepID=A0A7C1W8E0_9GAMM|nr:methylamine utilization protein [Methylophaga sp.]HEC74838.1 methylamine utilization protein [Methylophaga aminisulfidivorans]
MTNQEGVPLSDVVIEPIFQSTSTTQNSIHKLASIDQIDKQFKPRQIVIQKGQLVEFPNSDNIRHHVYSFSKAHVFELKLYANKPKSPILFEHAGVVVLGCNIHDSMIGYIYVADSNDAVQSDASGQATLSVESNVSQIRVWHSNQAVSAEIQNIIDINSLTNANDKGLEITIETIKPAARNSFEDVFDVDLSN